MDQESLPRLRESSSFPASLLRHSSRRLTITVPYRLYRILIERADQQGRSASNLAAYLLEKALDEPSDSLHCSLH